MASVFTPIIAAQQPLGTDTAQPVISPGMQPVDSLSPAAPGGAIPSGDTEVTGTDKADDGSTGSVFEIVRAAGIVGLLIVLLSVATVALVIEHMLTIRTSVLLPEALSDEIHDLLGAGRLACAVERCREMPSFLAHVLESGIIEIENGWQSVEKAVEDAMAEQASRLYRKIEYLSVIGNIAPMLGLLGTVVGMLLSFRVLADSQGAPSAVDLADGIYQALITTVMGLIVAIPSLAAFAIFRNRIDHLTAEIAYITQHAFGPVKRSMLRGPSQVPSQQPMKQSKPTQPLPPGKTPPPTPRRDNRPD